jgi:hypothetical protein
MNLLRGEFVEFHVVPIEDASEAKLSSFDNPRDYFHWITSYPTMTSQGDGMRSFAGAILSLLVQPRNIVLIDEPEAFLHPPQAKRLAETVAEETDENSQVFIATHDDEIVRALLDAAGNRVTIARITRNQNKNKITVLDHQRIAQLWIDPLLRTSAVLSSLFHSIALFCEGESDVRYFKALLDATRGEGREADYQFYHVGGKDRIASVASALSALGVPVIAIVDIDILADKGSFVRLLESLGGRPQEIQSDYQIIASSVADKGRLNYVEFSEDLRKLASDVEKEKEVSKKAVERSASIVRRASTWQRIKDVGKVGFNGEVLNAFERINTLAKASGLLINPEGELEGFCRNVSRSRKAVWLSEVIGRELATDPSFEEARNFAATIRGAIDAKLG